MFCQSLFVNVPFKKIENLKKDLKSTRLVLFGNIRENLRDHYDDSDLFKMIERDEKLNSVVEKSESLFDEVFTTSLKSPCFFLHYILGLQLKYF